MNGLAPLRAGMSQVDNARARARGSAAGRADRSPRRRAAGGTGRRGATRCGSRSRRDRRPGSRHRRPTSATRWSVPGSRSGSARSGGPAGRGCSRGGERSMRIRRDIFFLGSKGDCLAGTEVPAPRSASRGTDPCSAEPGRQSRRTRLSVEPGLQSRRTRRPRLARCVRSGRWLRRSRGSAVLPRHCTAAHAPRESRQRSLRSAAGARERRTRPATTRCGSCPPRHPGSRPSIDVRRSAAITRSCSRTMVPSVVLSSTRPRVSGVRGRRRLERRAHSALELQDRQRSVLHVDLVQQRRRVGEHAAYGPEHPGQEIDRVDALVDQRATSVERARAAPAGIRVVLGRAIPLDPCRREQRAAERAGDQQLAQADE